MLNNFNIEGIKFIKPNKKFILHSLISDHVVFQSDKEIEIFGLAQEGTIILVKLTSDSDENISYEGYTLVDETHEWMIKLPALTSSFNTYTLTVSDTVNTEVVKDILIGEVWVLAGQSNMGIRVKEMDEGLVTMALANEKFIRIFYQDESLNAEEYPYLKDYDVKGGIWKKADSGENIATCSAVGYTFAYELFNRLNSESNHVPLAIINTQKGGSSIHAWLDRDIVLKNEHIKNFVLSKNYSLDDDKWNTFDKKNYNQVSALFNRRVAPLMKKSIKGIIFYQGENDPYYDPMIYSLRELIDSYSRGFNKNDDLLYFGLIELHPYDGVDYILGPSEKKYNVLGFAQHRQAQINVALDKKYQEHVTIIPIYDISLKWNVEKSQFAYTSLLHPVCKKPVGKRTGQIIYSFCYAKDDRYLAPIYDTHEYDQNSITITLKNVGDGLLTFKNSSEGITTVEVILNNKERVSVKAEIISKNQIRITNVNTANVLKFAYSNFSRNEESNLANSEKIPALPFVISLR